MGPRWLSFEEKEGRKAGAGLDQIVRKEPSPSERT